MDLEGIRDLMIIWGNEQDSKEKDEIISDLQDEIDEYTNLRSILAIEPGTKDNVDSWRAVFASWKRRGLNAGAVRLGIMDGLPGLEKLFKEEFANSTTQIFWVHSLRNAIAKTPARLQEDFIKQARLIMYASSEDAARKAFLDLKPSMNNEAQRAIHCIEKDLCLFLCIIDLIRLYGQL